MERNSPRCVLQHQQSTHNAWLPSVPSIPCDSTHILSDHDTSTRLLPPCLLQYDRKAFRYKKNVVPRPERVCVPILNWFTLGLELYCSYCLEGRWFKQGRFKSWSSQVQYVIQEPTNSVAGESTSLIKVFERSRIIHSWSPTAPSRVTMFIVIVLNRVAT